MNGWPTAELIGALTLFLGVHFLIGGMTREGSLEPSVVAHDAATPASQVNAFFEVTVSGAPDMLEIHAEGNTLLSEHGGIEGETWFSAKISRDAPLVLRVQAAWRAADEKARQVVKIEVAPDGMGSRSASIWGNPVDETVSFDWE